jgi:hypothetical protein
MCGRAEIVLLSADGLGTHEIMRQSGKSKSCVWRWQERFVEEGVEGGVGGMHLGFGDGRDSIFGGGSRPDFDHSHRSSSADRDRFADRFHRRLLRRRFLAGDSDGYNDNYPYYAEPGNCYLTRHWVWNWPEQCA